MGDYWWGFGRASDVRGLAFGCLVTDRFGPLDPVPDLAREEVVQDFAFGPGGRFYERRPSAERRTRDRGWEER